MLEDKEARIDYCDGDLQASKVKGSYRQLFQRETSKSGSCQEDFSIRSSDLRSNLDIAKKLSERKNILTSIVGNIRKIGPHTQSDCFDNLNTLPCIDSLAPVIIEGCTSDNQWPAGIDHWSPLSLVNLLGKDRRMEVAGLDVTVSLGSYYDYMQSSVCSHDDDPVYIFETLVDGEHDEIINSFKVPSYFTESSGCHRPIDHLDLLSASDDDGLAFGLHRWLLIGPRYSGSCLHVDPLGTSAWNTLLLGRKLWVLFPPSTVESDIKSHSNSEHCVGDWFINVLPTIDPIIAASRIQFVQKEGETVYVPAGWHHAVLNLECTVCVTQNFASPCHYPEVASQLYSYDGWDDDGEVVDNWRVAVETHWPDLKDYINCHCVHCNSITLDRFHSYLYICIYACIYLFMKALSILFIIRKEVESFTRSSGLFRM